MDFRHFMDFSAVRKTVRTTSQEESEESARGE